MKRLWVLAILQLIVLGFAYAEAPDIVEVVPVYNRPASEIQPLLAPLLENDDRVIADGSNLLVRTTQDRLAEIKSIIQKLDMPTSNFLITVIQSRQATAEELNAQARAQLHVPTGNPDQTSADINAYTYQTQDRNVRDDSQTLRTLEGKPAFIKVGSTYPVQTYQAYGSGYGYSGYSNATTFVDASTGFQVTPRLSGEQVFLDVAPWSDKPGNQASIQTQQIQSTLKVNLGEWIEIGGAESNMQGSSNKILSRNVQTHDDKLHILVKVDRAD